MRRALAVMGLGSAFVVLVVMLAFEWVGLLGGSHLWDVTKLGIVLVSLMGAVMLAVWRVSVVRDIYTMGYRHGRHDANKSLLEAGLWISEAAEQDAERNIGEE